MHRRQFLIRTSIAATGVALIPAIGCTLGEKEVCETDMLHGAGPTAEENLDPPFQLPELPYAYSGLAPYIDERTMELHHTEHHSGYVRKLNNALKGHRLNGKSLGVVLDQLTDSEEDRDVLNNAGGHYNHSLFWKLMTNKRSKGPTGKFAKAIEAKFGSQRKFVKKFESAAMSVFGSGWAWLILDKDNELHITTTRNQENPLMGKVVEEKGFPVIGIDVWEHAYYLKYQNRRKEYVESFMELINWDYAGIRYNAGMGEMA